MPEYKVDKKVFSTDELSALLMGLTNLSGILRGEDFVHALAKVKSIIPADKARDIELKANQICIDLEPWMGNGNIKRSLETVKTALQENRLISFTYIDGHGNKTERVAEPYQLAEKQSLVLPGVLPQQRGLPPVSPVKNDGLANTARGI